MNALTPNIPQTTPSEKELAEIAAILMAHAGIVLAPGKGSMVQSRLQKRLRALGLNSYRSYIDLVSSQDGLSERQEMISALTTNVTNFFRENHHFETLKTTALPQLLASRGKRLRIWSAGCSNGQEAYSILMTAAESVRDFDQSDIRLLATDIDPVMVRRGTAGVYSETILEAVPGPLQKKYFQKHGEDFQVLDRLRNRAAFRELNIHSDWPMKGQFDIIFCRNMMIYFSPEAQNLLWKRFEKILAPGGWLFVGHSERVPLDTGSKLLPAGITTYRLPETG
ncbi:protein-glutamate O-methyltransferase [Thioclava litoralis]|uniref:Chemotaxis protein methyltransferase n=1 Tax=Thioclava litoralis TaxID=3076557 RepID=A0ABZ1DYS8_9RHOB|nr:protein-glutamate O-methyltransferase [Thioclava sp. FTW29]